MGVTLSLLKRYGMDGGMNVFMLNFQPLECDSEAL